MNIKRILFLSLVWGALIFSSCGDDDKPGLKEQFSFEDESFSLKDANVFLVYNDSWNERTERDYLVTDGTYDVEEDEYVDATYYIWVYLLTPEGEDEFEQGNYPQWWEWVDAPSTSKISYIEAYAAVEDENYFSFETIEDDEAAEPVEVSGGFDDGDNITFKYSGKLEYYYYDSTEEEWVTDELSGKFAVKGEVMDITSSGGPVTRQAKGRGTHNHH